MKKFLSLILCISLSLFCGCSIKREISDTRILMSTAVTITAECSKETISQAFDLCSELEGKLSRTIKGSDVWKINNSNDFVEVSEDTLFLINKALEYSLLTNGSFDITVCPVSSLYDFTGEALPDPEDIALALKSVDYKKIEVKGSNVRLIDGSIDLGGIAKGYIADKVVAFLKEKGVKKGIVNIGGNVYTFGNDNVTVGIKKPFSEELIAKTMCGEGTYVTSGIYERYIEKEGKIYHHVIDPSTGYGVENDLAAVTIIGKSSADADALSTASLLLGSKKGMALIENQKNTEAVFIKRDGTLLLTSGLSINGTVIKYK